MNQVRLGLVRVMVKDNATDYYLVPAYCFGGALYDYNEDGTVADKADFHWPIINAVDGSTFSADHGY